MICGTKNGGVAGHLMMEGEMNYVWLYLKLKSAYVADEFPVRYGKIEHYGIVSP